MIQIYPHSVSWQVLRAQVAQTWQVKSVVALVEVLPMELALQAVLDVPRDGVLQAVARLRDYLAVSEPHGLLMLNTWQTPIDFGKQRISLHSLSRLVLRHKVDLDVDAAIAGRGRFAVSRAHHITVLLVILFHQFLTTLIISSFVSLSSWKVFE